MKKVGRFLDHNYWSYTHLTTAWLWASNKFGDLLWLTSLVVITKWLVTVTKRFSQQTSRVKYLLPYAHSYGFRLNILGAYLSVTCCGEISTQWFYRFTRSQCFGKCVRLCDVTVIYSIYECQHSFRVLLLSSYSFLLVCDHFVIRLAY